MPSSGIDGGLNEKTKASLIPINAPIAFPPIASALSPSPLRSSHGFSGVNMIAFACPWPKKLKPLTSTMLSTCGWSSKNAFAWLVASRVRSVVAPGGAWITVIR